jgi:predicted GIY-YIG superfamily endonuclease
LEPSAKSEGCHAGAKRRRAILNFLSALQKTTAWQASLYSSRFSAKAHNRMNGFHYVYILVSEANNEMHYSGITRKLNARLSEHNQGKCPHTSKYRPWKIETAIAFRSEDKARRFERYLKTGSGREFARRHF